MITETQKLDEAQKEAIVEAAETYMRSKATVGNPKGLSQAKLAKLADITPAYLSAMVNRNWNSMKAGGKLVEISDQYFHKIAIAIAFEIEEVVWKHFNLYNQELCEFAFIDARETKLPHAIDGDTGLGKSHSVTRCLTESPEFTYVVTCADDMTAKGFIRALARAVSVNDEGTTMDIRLAIVRKLQHEKNALIIIDEAENLKDRSWGSIKAMMDSLKGFCGIVLIGANDFEKTLETKAKRNKTPFPQVLRRIREGGFIRLTTMEKSEVEDICMAVGIYQKEIIEILYQHSSNVGELEGNVKKLFRMSEEMDEVVSLDLAQKVLL